MRILQKVLCAYESSCIFPFYLLLLLLYSYIVVNFTLFGINLINNVFPSRYSTVLAY